MRRNRETKSTPISFLLFNLPYHSPPQTWEVSHYKHCIFQTAFGPWISLSSWPGYAFRLTQEEFCGQAQSLQKGAKLKVTLQLGNTDSSHDSVPLSQYHHHLSFCCSTYDENSALKTTRDSGSFIFIVYFTYCPYTFCRLFPSPWLTVLSVFLSI